MSEKITAPRVVLFWCGLNALAVGTLFVFGERPLVMIWSAGMVALIAVISRLIWLSQRRQARRGTWRPPPNGDTAILLALTAIVLGLALAFYVYVAIVAVIPFTFAVITEISARRGGLS